MSINIESKIEKDYLNLKFTGPFTLKEALKAYQCTIDDALKYDKTKILIDVNEVSGTMTTWERFETSEFLATYYQKCAFGKIKRIAFIGKEPLVDRQRFGETVAVNRYLNVRIFTILSEAIKWISD